MRFGRVSAQSSSMCTGLHCHWPQRSLDAWETVWSHTLNRVSYPPPVDPAEQLLSWSFRFLSQLWSCNCALFHHYRYSIGWAYNPACHDAEHKLAHFFSCPTYPTDMAPLDMRHPSRLLSSWLPSSSLQTCHLFRLTLTPFLLRFRSRRGTSSSCWALAGPFHFNLSFPPLSFHLLRPRYTRGFLTRASRLFGNDPASKSPSSATLLFSLGLSPSD